MCFFPNMCFLYVLFGLRMGKKDGFGNQTTKQLHDVGTVVSKRTKMTIHENVPGFEEDEYLERETGCTIQKAELPDFDFIIFESQ